MLVEGMNPKYLSIGFASDRRFLVVEITRFSKKIKKVINFLGKKTATKGNRLFLSVLQ